MPTTEKTFIDRLVDRLPNKASVELELAFKALGVVEALEQSLMKVGDSWYALFNHDNYKSIRRRRLSAPVRELFEWGMELESVEAVNPRHLKESYAAMRDLAYRIIRRHQQQLKKAA